MIDEEDESPAANLQRQARIEARQFARVFRSPDGKAVLASLKRDFGWEAAHPPLGPDNEVSDKAMRAWIGNRAVIATIIDRARIGEQISEDTTPATNNENEH